MSKTPNRSNSGRADKAPTGAQAIKADAAGQYRAGRTAPNKDGLVSANPVVLSQDGDATVGEGHGRDRDTKGPKSG
jgi:hypothetical protein